MPAQHLIYQGDVVLKFMLVKLQRCDKCWRFERRFVVSCKEYE